MIIEKAKNPQPLEPGKNTALCFLFGNRGKRLSSVGSSCVEPKLFDPFYSFFLSFFLSVLVYKEDAKAKSEREKKYLHLQSIYKRIQLFIF